MGVFRATTCSVAGRRPRAKHRRQQRAADAAGLVVGVDEQLVDMGADRDEVARDLALDAGDPAPVRFRELAGVAVAHLGLGERDPAGAAVNLADRSQIVRGRCRSMITAL